MAKGIPFKPLPGVTRAQVEPKAALHELYHPLGYLVVAFADLEAELTATLRSLLGVNWNEVAALEWLMTNVSGRIELFYFLAVQETAADKAKDLAISVQRRSAASIDRAARTLAGLRKSAESLYKDLQQANADRNNLLHGAWAEASSEDGTFSKTRLMAAGGKLSEIPLHKISLTLITQEIDFIISLNMRLKDWGERLRIAHRPENWPPPLPDIYLQRSPLGRLLQENRSKAQKPPPRSSRA
jgi:hypothetical protein